MGACTTACGGNDTAKVHDINTQRRSNQRSPNKKLNVPSTADDSDSEYDTDDDEGRRGPKIQNEQAMAKFKEYVKSGSEDLAVLMVDQHHDFDPSSASFPKGFDCLQMACRNEMPKLVLLLLEEGHSVKTMSQCIHHPIMGGVQAVYSSYSVYLKRF